MLNSPRILKVLSCCLAVLVCSGLFSQPVWANTPAGAVQGFFGSVASGDYKQAWRALSSTSQNSIINQVAQSDGMSPSQVRQLFDSNSPSIQKGFWTSFRTSSGASKLAKQKYIVQVVKGSRAAIGLEGTTKALFLAVQEGGIWKFGLTESLPEMR